MAALSRHEPGTAAFDSLPARPCHPERSGSPPPSSRPYTNPVILSAAVPATRLGSRRAESKDLSSCEHVTATATTALRFPSACSGAISRLRAPTGACIRLGVAKDLSSCEHVTATATTALRFSSSCIGAIPRLRAPNRCLHSPPGYIFAARAPEPPLSIPTPRGPVILSAVVHRRVRRVPAPSCHPERSGSSDPDRVAQSGVEGSASAFILHLPLSCICLYPASAFILHLPLSCICPYPASAFILHLPLSRMVTLCRSLAPWSCPIASSGIATQPSIPPPIHHKLFPFPPIEILG